MTDEYQILEEEDKLLGTWRQLQDAVETIGPDVYKNAAGNVNAGVRSRRGMRKLFSLIREIIRTGIERDKDVRSLRRMNKKVEKK